MPFVLKRIKTKKKTKESNQCINNNIHKDQVITWKIKCYQSKIQNCRDSYK